MNTIILAYLAVFLTWPVIGGLLIGCFLWLCSKQIRALIDRIASIKFPGGELSTSQQARTETAEPGPVTPATPPEPPQEGVQVSQASLDALRAYAEAERGAARIWEYRYLNFFLVPTTQIVLDWFIGLQQPTTIAAFEAAWMMVIQSAPERTAVLHALQKHVLIEISPEGAVTVTDKGREYAAWTERRRPAAA